MRTSLFAYGGRRYLYLALALAAVSVVAYAWHDPQEPPSGGTVLGYALGTLALALVVLLSAFGIRKRRYRSTAGTVQGWLSAHVYLGLALPFIVLLHAGFQLGPNVHTLAFVLLALVVASGILGAWFYAQYPAAMSQVRGGANREELLLQLADIDDRSKRAAARLGNEVQDAVTSGSNRTELGGSLAGRLFGRDRSTVALPDVSGVSLVSNRGQEALLDFLADQQAASADAERVAALAELSALLRSKRKLLQTLARDLQYQARLEAWLYLHVPLTTAMLAALVTHLLAVFIYW